MNQPGPLPAALLSIPALQELNLDVDAWRGIEVKQSKHRQSDGVSLCSRLLAHTVVWASHRPSCANTAPSCCALSNSINPFCNGCVVFLFTMPASQLQTPLASNFSQRHCSACHEISCGDVALHSCRCRRSHPISPPPRAATPNLWSRVSGKCRTVVPVHTLHVLRGCDDDDRFVDRAWVGAAPSFSDDCD